MLNEVVDALFVPAGASNIQYSQGFALNNDNNVTADVLMISDSTGATTATVGFQQSDDMQNWVTHTTSLLVFAAGAAPRKGTVSATGLISAYGRFKFQASAGDALFKVSAFTKRT